MWLRFAVIFLFLLIKNPTGSKIKYKQFPNENPISCQVFCYVQNNYFFPANISGTTLATKTTLAPSSPNPSTIAAVSSARPANATTSQNTTTTTEEPDEPDERHHYHKVRRMKLRKVDHDKLVHVFRHSHGNKKSFKYRQLFPDNCRVFCNHLIAEGPSAILPVPFVPPPDHSLPEFSPPSVPDHSDDEDDDVSDPYVPGEDTPIEYTKMPGVVIVQGKKKAPANKRHKIIV